MNSTWIFPLDLVFRPLRLLTALRFTFAKDNKLSFEDVDFKVTFYRTKEEVTEAKEDGGYGFTKLALLGGKWDYARYFDFSTSCSSDQIVRACKSKHCAALAA